jgi:hypothetical protein
MISRRFTTAALACAMLLGHAVPSRAQAPDPRLYEAIRKEGLERSRVMGFASGLADGIGGRLMGSPNMRRAYDWSLVELTGLGLTNVHLEPIGTFGLNWRQTRAWVRMSSPDSMMYVAQAAPWSVATHGPVEGEVIAVELDNDADLSRLRGHLAGKIVLLGPLRPTPPPGQLLTRYTDDEVLGGAAAQAVTVYYKTVGERRIRQAQEALFKARRDAFLAAEGVRAVILPSRETDAGGGGGLLAIDGSELGGRPWIAAERPPFPIAYVAIEDFGRAWRLARSGAAVRLELDIQTQEAGQAEPGYNVVADLPGSDPALAPQIVLAGAHLDSWAAGTGAVDNGAGVAATLEAVRILKALSLKPRRTIRVVLYGGEEQGLLGSEAYARQHLGHVPRSTAPDQMALAVEGRRQKIGPLQTQPAYETFSAAYNLDGGSGRIRAVFAGGNPALAATYRDWIAPLKDLGVLAVYDGPHWPADQSTFTEIGLPGISFLQDPLDYDSRAHHTNLDTLERISPQDLSQAATVLAIFLINSANADARLPRPGD